MFKVHISSMINPVQQESSSSSKVSDAPSHSQEEPELFIWQKKKKILTHTHLSALFSSYLSDIISLTQIWHI